MCWVWDMRPDTGAKGWESRPQTSLKSLGSTFQAFWPFVGHHFGASGAPFDHFADHLGPYLDHFRVPKLWADQVFHLSGVSDSKKHAKYAFYPLYEQLIEL